MDHLRRDENSSVAEAGSVPPANVSTKQPKAFYKPELDLLRFCAFGLVFLRHFLSRTVPTPSHWVQVLEAACEQGVQIFFLLSAYLITHLLLQEQAQAGTVDVRAFYIRRILRIWPVYFGLIFAAAILTACHLVPGFPLSALGYFTFLSGNWYVVLHGWLSSPVVSLWTISVEEQFYLIWPVTLLLFGRRGLATVIALVAVLSYGSLLLLGVQHTREVAVRANSFVQFQFFALGAGLAFLMQHRRFRPGLLQRWLLLGAATVVTVFAVAHIGILGADALGPGRLTSGYLALCISSALFFLFFLDAQLPRWLGPLTYLGRISYGLYAFHVIAIDASALLLARVLSASTAGKAAALALAVTSIPLSVGIAHLSYRYFELPFLRLKRRFTAVPSRDDMQLGPVSSSKRTGSLRTDSVAISAMPGTSGLSG